MSLISRFTGKYGHQTALRNYAHRVPRDMPSPSDSLDVTQLKLPAIQANNDLSVSSRLLMASIGSQGSMGGLLIAGFLLKTVGWRLILITGAVYGGLYLYERLMWTNRAKEREFKRQYVAHISKKLRLIVDLTSANCSHQVQQELSSTFACLCNLVDETLNEMDQSIKSLQEEISVLEETAVSAKSLRNKANYLMQELALFEETYLQSEV